MPGFAQGRRHMYARALAAPALVAALLAGSADAAIDVGVGCDAGVGRSTDLINAINLANIEGGGTIRLTAGCTYTFTQKNNDWYGPTPCRRSSPPSPSKAMAPP